MAGAKIPDFSAVLHDGRSVRLSELLADGPVVLFFYPKAFTPGCTAESCTFRDLAAEFAQVGAQPIGVSRDSVETQARFQTSYDLGFPLIADADGSVAQVFGVKRLGPLPSKRQTFVIDTDFTLLGVIRSELNMDMHATDALDLLRSRRDVGDDLRVEISLDEHAQARR